LAYLLPGLSLLLFFGGSLAAQTFSHAAALRTVKGCQPCHAPIPRSTEVSKREGRPVRWVKFSHAVHVKLGVSAALIQAIDAKTHLGPVAPELRRVLETGNVCQSCHRGMAAVSGALAKANYPAMSDCLVCHNKIDPPFSCEKCHAEEVRTLVPANHTAGFIDLHTNKDSVSKETCASCHGRRFTCMGCH
jgi:hypothetical protein